MSAPRFRHASLAQQEWNSSWQGQRPRPQAGRNVEALTVCRCAERRGPWRFCLSRAKQEHEDWTLASTFVLRSQFGLRFRTTTSPLEETTESMSGTHNEIGLEKCCLRACMWQSATVQGRPISIDHTWTGDELVREEDGALSCACRIGGARSPREVDGCHA